MSKRAMSPEQLRKRTEEMQGAGIPTSDAVAVGAQKRAVEAYVQGYQTRLMCIQQAVKASEGKQWTTNAIGDLMHIFHDFVTSTNAPTETAPESTEV